MSQAFHIGKLPLSPKSYGKPQLMQIKEYKFTLQKKLPMNFTSEGNLHQGNAYKNTSTWIKKAKEGKQTTPISTQKYVPRVTITQKRDMMDVVALDLKNKA